MNFDRNIFNNTDLLSNILQLSGVLTPTQAKILGPVVNASVKAYEAWKAREAGDTETTKAKLIGAAVDCTTVLLTASAAMNQGKGNATPAWLTQSLQNWQNLPQPTYPMDPNAGTGVNPVIWPVTIG